MYTLMCVYDKDSRLFVKKPWEDSDRRATDYWLVNFCKTPDAKTFGCSPPVSDGQSK